MLNKAVLMGRLTKDPELRHTQTNIPVASFTLAVERDFSGDRNNKETDFINIVAWRNTADFVSKWFRKGQLVAVSGRIQVRTWKDRDGNNRTSTEVVADDCYFAESKKSGPAPVSAPDAPVEAPVEPGADFEELIGDDGELPF